MSIVLHHSLYLSIKDQFGTAFVPERLVIPVDFAFRIPVLTDNLSKKHGISVSFYHILSTCPEYLEKNS